MRKCLPKAGMFRLSRLRLSSPREYPPQSPLTPQHPKAKLKLVNGIFRRSISKLNVSSRQSFDGTTDDVAKECAVADSFNDIIRENEWFLLNIEEPLPRARSKHAAVASEGNMYVVGGDSVDGQLGDVQRFNVDKFSWKQLCSAGLNDVRTRPREPEASLVNESGPLLPAGGPRLLAPFVGIWKGKLIAVGCEVSIPNIDSPVSVHAFDLSDSTWTILKPAGEVPDARQGYRIVQVKSKLVMFAGEDASGRILDDVFTLDLEKLAWKSLQTKGKKPAPRKYHAMACYGGRYIWIYGGKSYSTYYNDIYCLDLECLIWTNVKVEGAVPTVPRAGHVGIMQGENFYIIGGENRGDEMVDTLAFDIQKRAWSVVTSVNAMSPLAHNGLSVLKVKHGGSRYLVAFGGHGILLSCQMYALLLPAADQNSGCDSLSSLESLSVTSIFKNSTSPEEKTSPTDPFQFHGSPSLSSSSLESDSAVAAADNRLELRVEESSLSSQKERRKIKTGSSSPDFDSWERTPIRDIAFPKIVTKPRSVRTRSILPSEELHKLTRRSDIAHHELLPLLSQEGAGHIEEGLTQNNSPTGRFDSKDGTKSLGALFQSRDHSPPEDSPETDLKETGHKNDPHASEKKNRVDTGAINEQLRLVVKAINELQDGHKSSLAKDEDLNVALQTLKELQEEIQELRRKKENQERKMRQKLSSVELNTDEQSRRENPAEIDAGTEVPRGLAKELQEEIQERRRNQGNQERKMHQKSNSGELMTDKQSRREKPAETAARTEVSRGLAKELQEEIQERRRNQGNQERKMYQKSKSGQLMSDEQSGREKPGEIEARTEVARGQAKEFQGEIQELRSNKGNQERKMHQKSNSGELMTDKQSRREKPAETAARTEVSRGLAKELQEEIQERRRNQGNQERKMYQKSKSGELMTDKQSGREKPGEIEARTEVARGQAKEFQEEIQELRSNKGNQERKMHQKSNSGELLTDKQSRREKPAEIEARTEVSRGQAKEIQEEIQELRRNKRNQERKMHQKSNSGELMTHKQTGRENSVEIEARTEVSRGRAKESQEEIQELRRNKGSQEIKVQQKLNSGELKTDKQSRRENLAEIEARIEVARGPVKELQEEVQELRRYNGNQERKMHQKSISGELITDKESGRENPAEFEARAEVARGPAEDMQEEIQDRGRNQGNEERKSQQKSSSGELMTDKQSGRENPAEIEARAEVARGPAEDMQEEIQDRRRNQGKEERKGQQKSNSGELMTDKQSGRENPAEIEARTEVATGPELIRTKSKRRSLEIERLQKDAEWRQQSSNLLQDVEPLLQDVQL